MIVCCLAHTNIVLSLDGFGSHVPPLLHVVVHTADNDIHGAGHRAVSNQRAAF